MPTPTAPKKKKTIIPPAIKAAAFGGSPDLDPRKTLAAGLIKDTFKEAAQPPKPPAPFRNIPEQLTPQAPAQTPEQDKTRSYTNLKGQEVKILGGAQEAQTRQDIQQREIARIQAQGGARTQEEAIIMQRRQQEAQQQASQQAQQQFLQAGQQPVNLSSPGAAPDFTQAIGAGLVGAVPGVIGGAVAGAVGGAGIGAVPGAIAGGVGAFLVSARSNLKKQQAEDFGKGQDALTKGERNIRALITDTNQNPQNAALNIELFYKNLEMMDAAYASTWRDSQETFNKFLGEDATEELAAFERFNLVSRPFYISRFNEALGAPNPSINLIFPEDLTT